MKKIKLYNYQSNKMKHKAGKAHGQKKLNLKFKKKNIFRNEIKLL